MKITKIFEDAKDKNVRNVLVYADTDKDLFYDSACTKAVPASECVELFKKGVIALYSNTYYKAISCTTAGVINFGFPA